MYVLMFSCEIPYMIIEYVLLRHHWLGEALNSKTSVLLGQLIM